VSEIIPALCAQARAHLADDELEFAEAVAAGDLERASAVAGESFDLAAALERQERAMET
jgi:hypothetical protein